MNTVRNFFLTREKNMIEVEVLQENAYKRKVKVLEGDNKDKVISVHPKGVAWGSMYPRVFQSNDRPSHVFVYHGRCLVGDYPLTDYSKLSIPDVRAYQFQPFVSDVIDSIHAKDNVLLTGGSGVGKTSHIMQLAARINQPVARINFNGETRMSDLVGKMTVVAGETKWVDGVIPHAMRHGYWLILDEIDFAEPAVLSLLHPVLEDNPSLTLKENEGEIIRPHSNFRVFGTANSIGAMSGAAADEYGGTNTMNAAFLDRWQVIFVNNLPEKEEIKVIRTEVPGLSLSTAKRLVGFANMVRNQDTNVAVLSSNFSTRKLISWAKKTALHRDAVKGAKISWLDKIPMEDQNVIVNILKTNFGSKSGRGRKKEIFNAKGVSTAKKRK